MGCYDAGRGTFNRESVLPSQLSLRMVTVRLPEYILRALEWIARSSGTTLSTKRFVAS